MKKIGDILKGINEAGVISIIRGIDSAYLEETLEALYKGGIRCVEITMNTRNALAMIERTKALYGDRFIVGAGTVLDKISARQAILAGADFILAPTLSSKVIEMCNLYEKLAVPGVFTPTEALEAKKAGAQLIKVFPVTNLGPQYIKDILGPLDQLNLLPVGGVSEENAAAYIKAGAFAIGVGSCLVSKKDVECQDFDKISKKAKAIVDEVKVVRGGI